MKEIQKLLKDRKMEHHLSDLNTDGKRTQLTDSAEILRGYNADIKQHQFPQLQQEFLVVFESLQIREHRVPLDIVL